VRAEEALRLHPAEGFEAVEPRLPVYVRRRCDREHVVYPGGALPGRVAHEGCAARLVKIADVVRCVAGRVGHVQAARGRRRSQRERDAVFDCVHPVFGHRQHLAPERIHLVAVEAARTFQQARGVGHVRGACGVDVHVEIGPPLGHRAGGAGVVEVDVREQQGAHVIQGVTARAEARLQPLQRGRRAGVHQREAAAGKPEHAGGEVLRRAHVPEVHVPGARIDGGCWRFGFCALGFGTVHGRRVE
jgi:hypothetical protein